MTPRSEPDEALRYAADAAAHIEVVPMRRRHLRGVLRVEAANEHRPWSLGLFMSELGRRSGRVYAVAKADGAVVGFAGLLFSGDDAHITTIAAAPERRGEGIGTRLMLILAQRAVATGATALTLEVRASNLAAQALYRRFGLTPAGVRKNYYSELGEDALVMWAHDIDGPAYSALLDDIAAAVAPTTPPQTPIPSFCRSSKSCACGCWTLAPAGTTT